jgi:hypothetical protein
LLSWNISARNLSPSPKLPIKRPFEPALHTAWSTV